MSHPNPSHDQGNSYPSDDYKPVRKAFRDKRKRIASKMGESKIDELKRLIGESESLRRHPFGVPKTRLEKHRAFVKANPNRRSPHVRYEGTDDHHREHKERERKQL